MDIFFQYFSAELTKALIKLCMCMAMLPTEKWFFNNKCQMAEIPVQEYKSVPDNAMYKICCQKLFKTIK